MAVKIGIVVFWLKMSYTMVDGCKATWHHTPDDHSPMPFNLKLENIPKKIYHV